MYFRSLLIAANTETHASGAEHPLGWVNLTLTGEHLTAFQTFTVKNNNAKKTNKNCDSAIIL